jgi:hypothetical protein
MAGPPGFKPDSSPRTVDPTGARIGCIVSLIAAPAALVVASMGIDGLIRSLILGQEVVNISADWVQAIVGLILTALFVIFIPVFYRRSKSDARESRFADDCCPFCGYRREGLPEPRCPECGATWSANEAEKNG